jgi:hypothetical protein
MQARKNGVGMRFVDEYYHTICVFCAVVLYKTCIL